MAHALKKVCFSLSCLVIFYCLACERNAPVVARVGEASITQSDVALREQVLRLSYPQYSGDLKQAALKQLVDSYVRAAVLRNNGQPIADETLRKEAERIDKTTLLPEALQKIKAIFKGDTKAYHQVYVLPVYADRVIYYEFFLHDKKIHAESLKEAEVFLSEARLSKVFRTENFDAERARRISGQDGQKSKAPFSALKSGVKTVRFTVSLGRGVEWEAAVKNGESGAPPQPEMPKPVFEKFEQDKKRQESEEGKRWIHEVIQKLKLGETHPQVIDQQTEWWVVRYLRPKPKAQDTYEMEAAVFGKADFNAWFEAERKRVHVVLLGKSGES